MDIFKLEKQKSTDTMKDDDKNSILHNYFNGLGGTDSGLSGGNCLQFSNNLKVNSSVQKHGDLGTSHLIKSQSVMKDVVKGRGHQNLLS